MEQILEQILEFLSSYGLNISINENTNPLVLIALAYFIFTCIIIFNIINISIFLISIYLININKHIEKLSIKYPYVYKIIKYHNNSRIGLYYLN